MQLFCFLVLLVQLLIDVTCGAEISSMTNEELDLELWKHSKSIEEAELELKELEKKINWDPQCFESKDRIILEDFENNTMKREECELEKAGQINAKDKELENLRSLYQTEIEANKELKANLSLLRGEYRKLKVELEQKIDERDIRIRDFEEYSRNQTDQLKLVTSEKNEQNKELKELTIKFQNDVEKIKGLEAKLSQLEAKYQSELLKQSTQSSFSTNVPHQAVVPDRCPSNGLQCLQIGRSEPFVAHCNEHENVTGWILIQKRGGNLVSFDRNMTEYINGFGSPETEFFLGLEKLHQITAAETFELLVQFGFQEVIYSSFYDTISVADKRDDFRLRLGTHEGHFDGLFYNNNQPFHTHGISYSSFDNTGGWWFSSYLGTSNFNARIPILEVGNKIYNPISVKMMIRPKNSKY